MRWTRWSGAAALALMVSGCVYGYQSAAFQGRYSTASRPQASYFCYDCHGYSYFDPYYDYCVSNGFRYRWADQPQVMALYRERYVRIKETHPSYGRYRYKPDYRAAERYREGADYDTWRSERARAKEPERAMQKKKKKAPELDPAEQDKRRKTLEPRTPRPRGGRPPKDGGS